MAEGATYCQICGAEICAQKTRQRFCAACRRKNKSAAQRRYIRQRQAAITEQERNNRMLQAQYQCKELRYSMRYTFDELICLANQYGTSYGKFYAWINSHKRLPDEGEALF